MFLLFGRVYQLRGKTRNFLDLSNDEREVAGPYSYFPSFTNLTLHDVNGGSHRSADWVNMVTRAWVKWFGLGPLPASMLGSCHFLECHVRFAECLWGSLPIFNSLLTFLHLLAVVHVFRSLLKAFLQPRFASTPYTMQKSQGSDRSDPGQRFPTDDRRTYLKRALNEVGYAVQQNRTYDLGNRELAQDVRISARPQADRRISTPHTGGALIANARLEDQLSLVTRVSVGPSLSSHD